MLLKSGERGGQEVGQPRQSIGDQTPDSNIHERICHNGVVPHHVKTTYGV